MNKSVRPITFAVCGFGSRGCDAYAYYQKSHPQNMKIVAVADPRKARRDIAVAEFGVSEEMCFASGEEMLAQDKLADVMIVATQDHDHYKYAIPALKKGYDLLLEKPISPVLSECLEIRDTANSCGRLVMVCHELRYAPFYNTISSIIKSGKIGRLEHIDASENVGYWHYAHSYVRGNWRSSVESSPIILAKTCHDMDLLRWFADSPCKRVSSFGSLDLFRAENAPEGSAERCCDCKARENCPYDAYKIYLTDERTGLLHGHNGWPCNVITGVEPTEELVNKAIETGPYGRCVYHCDNDVADHQTLNAEFENGVTASFSLSAFSNECHRTITVMGTMGEIYGDAEDKFVTLHRFGQPKEVISLCADDSNFAGHGGGDYLMLADLIRLERANVTDTLTGISASVDSHVMALAAEESRINGGKKINLREFAEKVK